MSRVSGSRRVAERSGVSDVARVDLVGARIAPPVTRTGAVPRTVLVDRLCGIDAPVVAVVAPTGYGKTTLVAQWAEKDPRDVAWLTLDETDNDPVVLLSGVVQSVGRIEPFEGSLLEELRTLNPYPGVAHVPRVTSALSSLSAPLMLVLDDLHALHTRQSKDALSDLIERMPPIVQVVLICRTTLPVRTPTLRARGQLVEIGPADLALDDAEAQMLLRGAGVEASRADVSHLNRLTEGWPAGLYLTALSLKDRALATVTPTRLAADDAYVADFLRSEVLSRLPRKDVSFLTKTSILERMTGPLCDAVLGSEGASETLESLAKRNLFVTQLDRQRRWYRYHHMFQAMLRSELDRVTPDEVHELHRRAAVWCQENGLMEDAIVHARAAGDGDRFAQLFVLGGFAAFREGRVETARRWGDWFEEDGLIERHPDAAAVGASMYALIGDPAAAERWLAAAQHGALEERAPDGSPTVASWVAALRAFLCRDGPERMREDAQAAVDVLLPASPLRPMALVTLGASHLLRGDVGAADAILADAVETASHTAATGTTTAGLSLRAFIAIERSDWLTARSFAEAAIDVVRRWRLEGYMTSAIAFVAAARVAAHLGDPARARQELIRAHRLRPLLTHAVPWLSVMTLLEKARVYLALADPSGGRTLLREIDEILRRRPELGVLPLQAEELRRQIATIRGTQNGSVTLTTAELRLLPLLATHLTFREIGARLYISPNTVKTQAISVYRKLGTNSRGGTVERAAELGLIDA
jgi:LuxR family maltose regulon positive regulatory protein